MSYDRTKPYNDLPPLPPALEVETKAVLKGVIVARAALAALKAKGAAIPNQGMLINSLVLQEAQASSEIENILTTSDALFKAFTSPTGRVDPATKEVLRYRQALWAGFEALRVDASLTTEVFIRIVRTITDSDISVRDKPGTIIKNLRNNAVIYTPPEGAQLIHEKLGELERFIRAEDDMDPLVRLALVHYQFEAIHPFVDGNGRTGRVISILYLVLKGLLDMPILYLSKYIIDQKTEYYRLLTQVTERAAWEPWVLFMLRAVEETASITQARIEGIRELLNDTAEKARRLLPSRVYSKELIEVLFAQPYVKARFLVDAGIAQRQTAAEYLKELARIGILKPEREGREVLYQNTALYGLLSKDMSTPATHQRYASMYGAPVDT
jgi:Fic family protein